MGIDANTIGRLAALRDLLEVEQQRLIEPESAELLEVLLEIDELRWLSTDCSARASCRVVI